VWSKYPHNYTNKNDALTDSGVCTGLFKPINDHVSPTGMWRGKMFDYTLP